MKKISNARIDLLLCKIACLTLIGVGETQAQFEPQFTQYMFNEMFINPAYAGSREQVAATMLYRNQWVGLEGAPKTANGQHQRSADEQKTGTWINHDE
jgi:hypothetical protein